MATLLPGVYPTEPVGALTYTPGDPYHFGTLMPPAVVGAAGNGSHL